jgi:catechol 2,3-dioxygenase-like lactoylglutathione lyase family enzyme
MIALADCAISVSNAKEAAQWWSDHLGFAVHRVGNGAHGVMVAPPGDRFVLHLCEGFETVQPGNSGIAFMTDEIEALVARMEGSGVRFTEPLRKESWGSFAKFADPDGNIYWLLGSSTAFVRTEATRRAPSRPGPKARPTR